MFSFFNKFKDFFQKKPGELVLAGMILIGLALISFYFTLFLFSLSDIEEGVASVHLEIAQKTKSKIEGILDENVKALNDLAQILDVSKEKKIIIDRFLKERKAFTQIAVLDNQGWEILKSSRALVFAPEDLRDFFWSETFVTPMEGEIYLSRVYFSEKSEPLLTISLPIKSSPGQISGVLSAEFSLQEIWNTVAEIEYETISLFHRRKNFFRLFASLLRRSQEKRRIKISLDRNRGRKHLTSAIDRNIPINADYICFGIYQ